MSQKRMAVWASGEDCNPMEEINQAVLNEDHDKLNTWRDSIDREKKGDLTKLNPVLCRILDGIFRNYFITAPKKGTIVVSSHFMGSNADARKEWASYLSEFLPALRTAQSKGQLPIGFTARAALDLHWNPESSQPFPFLTESVVEAFHAILFPVKDSITEVSVTSFTCMTL
jgi:hypothetical protein